ncbi:hypothetical protein AQZ52_08130 [Novosphingobium fuchskuhlense]|uniref:Uncharacterized protein n=1 Tax=Novosphingobium fuchskuhlense TaxID=1117702 RepID=A0A117UVE7_9SPHN|nr:hypothetical protein AQZ52_08130 [Novosphingobium fuchskuhlense]
MVELLGAAHAVPEKATMAQAMAAIPDRSRGAGDIRMIRCGGEASMSGCATLGAPRPLRDVSCR